MPNTKKQTAEQIINNLAGKFSGAIASSILAKGIPIEALDKLKEEL